MNRASPARASLPARAVPAAHKAAGFTDHPIFTLPDAIRLVAIVLTLYLVVAV